METAEIKSILESLLFMSGDPLTMQNLKKIIQAHERDIEAGVQELIDDYRARNSGLLVVQVAGGVQMVTNPVTSPWVKKFLTTVLPTKLSRQALETLAIVAYKQPITKTEIEVVRGVNSDGVVRTLLERRLVKILGRKEVPGRPLLYGTTKEFLQYFGLRDLSELPTLKEFEELEQGGTGEHPEQEHESAESDSGASEEEAEALRPE